MHLQQRLFLSAQFAGPPGGLLYLKKEEKKGTFGELLLTVHPKCRARINPTVDTNYLVNRVRFSSFLRSVSNVLKPPSLVVEWFPQQQSSLPRSAILLTLSP